jgi:CMP/dCMP kinase
MINYFQISIDGPTAAGKTTLGTGLADHFGAAFLDTGLTFRSMGYLLSRGELPVDDSWRSLICHVPYSGEKSEKIIYREQDVTEELWGFEVDTRLDLISRDPVRRAQILSFHRQIVDEQPRLVAAGRDVAVTLLTDASLHVFLTADFPVRRTRRKEQFMQNPVRSAVVSAVTERDIKTLEDCRCLPNSIILDTTNMPARTVLNYVIGEIGNIKKPKLGSDQNVFG